jgi:dTDP-4-amino-4,6-dideoxygalactose transaminase
MVEIEYGRPVIDESDIESVLNVLRGNWLTSGPKLHEFEEKLTQFIGSNTITVSSGTAALHAAFSLICIEPGDEIICSPMTFISNQTMAMALGLKIILCDIDAKDGNIDVSQLESLITKKTKAIVVTDFAGQPCDLDIVKNICKKNNLIMIEDAAHSFGTLYKGNRVGTIADFTTFSFYPTKNITTGEGGAISALDTRNIEEIKKFARLGIERNPDKYLNDKKEKWIYEAQKIGFNYRLDELSCALGISQLNKVDKFRDIKNSIRKQYKLFLEDLDFIHFIEEHHFTVPNWHLFPILVEPKLRESIYNDFHNNGIKVQVNYIPTHFHPVMKEFGYKKGQFPQSENFYSQELSLPLFPDKNILNESYMHRIYEILKEIKIT